MTPSGLCSNPPQEYQEGEAGFVVMFPSMEGVHIKPFHFCKETILPTALQEAGKAIFQVFDSLKRVTINFVCIIQLFIIVSAGLVDNPELRVVLLFVYEAYKAGGVRFLSQILEPLAKSKALIAGGLVDSVFSPTRSW